MDLTFNEFVEILASFRTPDRSKDAGDQRRARRIGYRAQLKITLCGNNTCDKSEMQLQILMRDFSSRGISFLCDMDLERGQSFVLQLNRPNNEIMEMLCSVVHSKSCRPGNTAPFQIGAEFICQVHPQPDESLADLDQIRQSILG
ncbi:MAG: PilZ domain-containing protein [Phycisphaerales bacterium]|jgi:hypothetical protein|nr:PilZ domain-containing protein [Phycisphaerales bacterium]